MIDPVTPAEAFARAVEIAGGQAPTSRLVDVTQGAIWQRLNGSKPAAAEWVLKLEAATGISRHDLRPDIYPRENTTAPRAASLDKFGAAR